MALAALPQVSGAPLALDASVLEPLTGGDRGEMRAVLDDFLDSCSRDLIAMQRAREAGDNAQLAREAHKIKGAARLVGAGELALAASELELAAKGNDWPQLLPLTADVQTAARRLALHVRQHYG